MELTKLEQLKNKFPDQYTKWESEYNNWFQQQQQQLPQTNLQGITEFDPGNPIHCLGEKEEEINDDGTPNTDFESNLDKQLKVQQFLYNFFGTKPKDEVLKYLYFIPKGSIFFHGDNINEGEMKYTKIKTIKKIVDDDGNHFYQVETKNISLDKPAIKIQTQDSKRNIIDNMITQPSALLSKAGNLRLTASINYANKLVLEEKTNKFKYTPNDKELENLIENLKKINSLVTIIYDNSEKGLMKKQKEGYYVFDDTWTKIKENEKYKFKKTKNNKKENITDALLTQLTKKLDTIVKSGTTEEEKDILTKYYLNAKSEAELSNTPEDVLLKPPSKTQMFGNPCAETNIALKKGSDGVTSLGEVKTDAKYLYTMQVYMFQNDIYLLDYSKLRHIFRNNEFGQEYTGLDKRSMFWGKYFKSIDEDDETKTGFYTLPFDINTDIKLTETHSYDEKTYTELSESYKNSKYSLRNYQPKEDTPMITHLNFILNLRGFSINIQGFTDFDPAELYITPKNNHPNVIPLFKDPNVIVQYNKQIMCREFNVYNSPKNLLYLCYASTLPNYSETKVTNQTFAEKIGVTRGNKLFDKYFVKINTEEDAKKYSKAVGEIAIIKPEFNCIEQNGTRTKKEISLLVMNNNIADPNPNRPDDSFYGEEKLFVDFTHSALFEEKAKYTKSSVNMFKNSFLYKKKYLKMLKKIYLSKPILNEKGKIEYYPQFIDLQTMLDTEKVRIKLYNTIFEKLKAIGFTMVYTNGNGNNQNIFSGFKLVKYDNSELTEFEMSNFINKINSGKIEAYVNGVDLLSQKDIIVSKNEDKFIHTHNIQNFRHFDGFLFDLLDFIYNCSLNVDNCTEIANKIINNTNQYVQEIIKKYTTQNKSSVDKVQELLTKISEDILPPEQQQQQQQQLQQQQLQQQQLQQQLSQEQQLNSLESLKIQYDNQKGIIEKEYSVRKENSSINPQELNTQYFSLLYKLISDYKTNLDNTYTSLKQQQPNNPQLDDNYNNKIIELDAYASQLNAYARQLQNQSLTVEDV